MADATNSTAHRSVPTKEYISNHYRPMVREILSSASAGWQLISATKAATQAGTAIVAQCAKAAEAQRQSARIRPYIQFLADDPSESAQKKRESVSQAIGLIHTFSTTPLPVPIASLGDDHSTLFINHCGFYGDIELDGENLEYFLRWTDPDGTEKEEYGEEPAEGDRIPPKLLFRLYSQLGLGPIKGIPIAART